MKKRIFINALGWDNYIYNCLKFSDNDIIIEYKPQIDETIEDLKKALSNEECYIYTFSFGGIFLEYVLNKYPYLVSNIKKVYYYDSLHINRFSQEELNGFRKCQFNTVDEILSANLSTDELTDPFKCDLVLQQFNKIDNKFIHKYDNEFIINYMTLVNDTVLPIKFEYETKIYSAVKIDGLEKEIISILPEEHLMMIEKIDVVQSDIDENN